MDQNDFIKGALLGAFLGGITALLAAPKSGKELRDDLTDGYNAVNRKSHQFADGLKEQSQCLMDTLSGHCNGTTSTGHNTFVVGGTLGAVLGAIAALLLAPQSGNKLREHLGDRYEDIREKAEDVVKNFGHARENIEGKMEDWKETLLTIVEKLSSHKGGKHSHSMDDILHWANLGLRLYGQFQKGR